MKWLLPIFWIVSTLFLTFMAAGFGLFWYLSRDPVWAFAAGVEVGGAIFCLWNVARELVPCL